MAISVRAISPRHISDVVHVMETTLADDRRPVLCLIVVETWNLLAVEVADIAVCGVVSEDWGLSLLGVRERISQELGLRTAVLVALDVLMPSSPRLVVVWISMSLVLNHAFSSVSFSHSIIWLAVNS